MKKTQFSPRKRREEEETTGTRWTGLFRPVVRPSSSSEGERLGVCSLRNMERLAVLSARNVEGTIRDEFKDSFFSSS